MLWATYPPDQVHVAISERILTHAEREHRRIFTFLGVEQFRDEALSNHSARVNTHYKTTGLGELTFASLTIMWDLYQPVTEVSPTHPQLSHELSLPLQRGLGLSPLVDASSAGRCFTGNLASASRSGRLGTAATISLSHSRLTAYWSHSCAHTMRAQPSARRRPRRC